VFPRLPALDPCEPDWVFRTDPDLPDPVDPVEVGTEPVHASVNVRLLRHATGYLLDFDDTGAFQIDLEGREIRWRPPRGEIVLDDVRQDVLGRVFAVALHLGGVTTLHGSGVVLPEGAVAFMAPKLHGKSTTAAALVRGGAKLLSDDILGVELDDPVRARPGVPTMNLRTDSARAVQVDLGDYSPDSKAPKGRFLWGESDLAIDPAPLAAVYLLAPMGSDTPEPTRSRIPAHLAALALMGQSKIGGLLGKENAPGLLEAMTEVASRVPCYTLRIPADLGRLGELVERIRGWHGGAVKIASGPAT
jgi:hypothetical protein